MTSPVQPRPAATVILMRTEPARGLEVLMVRRVAGARFMPSVWVFAGGAVDPADREAASQVTTDAEVDPDELAHRICAAREVGEESAINVAVDVLTPWSRWVTPVVSPIRFDTRFYVARSTPSEIARPDMREVDAALWISPGKALEERDRGQLEISFPTTHHLEELRGYPDVDAVLEAAARRTVTAITPRVVAGEDTFEVLLPGDPGFAD